jgi:hypothetical protein
MMLNGVRDERLKRNQTMINVHYLNVSKFGNHCLIGGRYILHILNLEITMKSS